ncbi:TorA-specific chaperone [Rhodovulum sulfidophilum]|uniref:TorD/DmsD family molecular chaperone n=1 Tax=Rhodovulum sulfidophilum TaxID=35806 RepID=UPI0005A5DE4D|nr:molecular chaperone TorD family protein [Rhodovulum sulfidophilum]ANB36411.1 hypothetical protein A6W98_19825 [Rhodovulum sulfidophilum DSM 1374]MCW2304841.1 TorA-specific chaperone [Rhodovulum sulfidophilum]
MTEFLVDMSEEEAADLAFMAEFLASLLLTPPDRDCLQALRSMQGQVSLGRIGGYLGEETAVDAIRQILTAGSAEEVAVSLERRHTALFEGIFRQRSLPPYASAWDGTGRLCGPAVGRMQQILRDLDIHLEGTSEMPDHIGIQLATLAEALRRGRPDIAARLLDELDWCARFGAALIKADDTGFYGALARLVLAFKTLMTADEAAAQPLHDPATARI